MSTPKYDQHTENIDKKYEFDGKESLQVTNNHEKKMIKKILFNILRIHGWCFFIAWYVYTVLTIAQVH